MQYKPTGVILMTALIPTIGHQFLIDFAHQFMKNAGGSLHVIICSRSQEPISGAMRLSAFREHYLKQIYGNKIKFYLYENDDAPQNPSDHFNFWNFWKETIENITQKTFKYLFASENYGVQLANALNASFVPCDISRKILPVKGNWVRSDIYHNFEDILPEMRKYLRTKITLFGAESTGKTTIGSEVAHRLGYHFVPEWAREYLETVGAQLSADKMRAIATAQYALQTAVSNELMDKQGIIFDTDLGSTFGYFKIYNGKPPEYLRKWFQNSLSDLYIVMNSNIPFVPDKLRYGIDKRESTDEFWIDILKEFNCKYHVIKSTDKIYQINEVVEVIKSYNFMKFGSIKNFIRD